MNADRDHPARSVAWRFTTAEVVSGAGDGIFWVSLIVALSGSPRFEAWLVVAVLARLGPRAFLGLAARHLLDRVPLRRLLVAVDLVRTALGAVMAALAASGAPPLALLSVVLVSYVVGVPTRPAMNVALTRTVAERDLARANARLSTVRQVMTFVGPLIGAGIAAGSVTAGFVANAASFAVAAAIFASVRRLGGAPSPLRSLTGGRPAPAVRGLGAELGGTLVIVTAMYFVRGVEMVLHVLVVRDVLDGSPDLIGVLSGAIAVGAFVAIPVATRLANAGRPWRASSAGIVATAVPTAALAAAGELWAAALLLVVVGGGMVVFEVVAVMTVQRLTDPATIGTAFAAMNSATNLGKLAGALAAPLLAALVGTRGALVATAVVLVAVAAATTPSLRRAGATASARSHELEPVVRVLRSLALFDAAPQAALERIAAAVSPASIRAGETVVREGDAPDDLFVVRDGSFSVTVEGRAVNTVGAGEWFGEIGLVRRIPRTATVTATGDATVWRIPGDVFVAALDESGAAPSALLDGIADRLARGAAR